jgi:hypothetical protein
VVITATLAQFNIPEAGLLLDPGGRSLPRHGPLGTNVVGTRSRASSCAMGGQLDPPEPVDIEPPHAPAHVAAATAGDEPF